MKVKIIKREARDKSIKALPIAAKKQQKNSDERSVMAVTVKSWIDDLRQKRENELLLARKFSKGDYCPSNLAS